MAAGNPLHPNNHPTLFGRLSQRLTEIEDAIFYTFFPKTRLDLLYENLHEAENVAEGLELEFEQKERAYIKFVAQTQAENESQKQVAELSKIQDQLREEKEYIAETTHNIKLHKANRKWYDVSKWSTNEKIARVWYAFLYSLLCGISIFASVTALGLPVSAGALLFLPLFAACVSFAVNLNGFWDNVAKLLDEKNKDDIKGKSSVAYKIFSICFISVAAILSTAMGLSTVAGSLGIAGQSYWVIFPVLLVFATTVTAVQGLFTQEPRKWFKSFGNYGLKESLIRTAIRLWHGLVDPVKYGDTPRNKWGDYPKANIIAGMTRYALFFMFTGIVTYAAVATAPFAAEKAISISLDFVRHIIGASAFELFSNIYAASFLAPIPIVPILSLLFIGYTLCFGSSLSGKLSVLATEFIGKGLDVAAEPYRHQHIVNYPERQIILTLIPVLPLLALGNVLWTAAKTLLQKEVSCWKEAAHYTKIQVDEKQSRLALPHFIGRLIYNHLPIWGTVNALNNGALTTYGKFNGEDIKLSELGEKEIIDASLAGGTGFTRSYGFFWLTKGPRDHEMEDQEELIQLHSDQEIPYSKHNRTATAEEKEGYKSYKTYDEFFANRPVQRIRNRAS